MRRAVAFCAVILTFTLLVSACGQRAADTGSAYFRATDYLEFTTYPDSGLHTNTVGVRELHDTGFQLRVSTHAELDYSVGADQLGEMTEALGGQLMQAYRWRLENRYTFDYVELTAEGMEELIGLPAYHAAFAMQEDGIRSLGDFYCIAVGGALCTLEFVYEDTKANAENKQSILTGMRRNMRWGEHPAHGQDWEDDYTPPTYMQGADSLLEQEKGAKVRIDGVLIAHLDGSGRTASLQLLDESGYYWKATAPTEKLTKVVEGILEQQGLETPHGVSVTVYGSITDILPHLPDLEPGENPAYDNPLELGPVFLLEPDYLITAEDGALYKFR